MTLVSLKIVIFDQYRHGRLNRRFQIVESSTREELTTEADFPVILPLTGDVCLFRGLCDGRQLQEGEDRVR